MARLVSAGVTQSQAECRGSSGTSGAKAASDEPAKRKSVDARQIIRLIWVGKPSDQISHGRTSRSR